VQEAPRPPGEALACSACRLTFGALAEQRDHCRLDLHRYNLKQGLRGLPPLTEGEFEGILEQLEGDEEEEISGSEDEEEEAEEGVSVLEARVVLETADGRLVAVHRCLLAAGRELPGREELRAAVLGLPARTTWAVIMLGGGHFAGAVFRAGALWVHKTFHSYTVRAKQGGSQGSADNKSGGSHAKSAGASLRRYNEQQQLQHIQDITKEWAEPLAACHLIFYRAAASNRSVLFGGSRPALDRTDPRLRSIPFQTRRATLGEVKRVQQVLGRLELLDRDRLEGKEGSPGKRRIHRSKSREAVVREVPGVEVLGREEEGVLGLEEVVLTTGHLQEFECTAARKNKGKGSKSRKDLEGPPQQEEASGLDGLRTELLTAVRSGNTKLLELVAARLAEGEEAVTVEELVNTQFGESKSSCLHLAAREGQRAVLAALLAMGADPAARDKAKKVPYNYAKDRETRNCFRKFMGDNPDRFDYKSAQIPPPLDKDAEEEKEKKANEKKKAQRSAKREKEKVVKVEEQKVKAVEEERQRFLHLTDREKRALAAERRLLGR
jgi:hypothetical protein